jgi:hypothetical protein
MREPKQDTWLNLILFIALCATGLYYLLRILGVT